MIKDLSPYAIPGLKRTEKAPLYSKAEEIMIKVSRTYGITLKDLKGKKRDADLVFPRHLAMFLIKRHCFMTLTTIGRLFDRDHTSVIHAIDSIENYISTDSHGRRSEILSFL